MRNKPTIAIFKFTGCAGCQLEILHLEDQLLAITEAVDFAYWMMVKRKNLDGPYDISLVEGSVSTPREIKEIKKVRANTKVLVALGDCAVSGCIPSIKNWIPQRELEKTVYEDLSVISSIKIHGIDEYVSVDTYLKGCPPDRNTVLELLKGYLLGVKPFIRPHCVCVECKLRENGCLITAQNRPCMGPVTNAGCGALCPSLNRECEGCYGPMSNPNASSLSETLSKIGLTRDEIMRKFRKYAGTKPEFRRETEAQ